MQPTPPPPDAPSLFDDYYFRRLVPPDHPLLKIAAVTDFSFAREEVAPFYSEEPGRPPLDPEFMFKLCFLQSYYTLSDREVVERAQTDLACRAFLQLDLEEKLPHHSSLSRFRTRLGAEGFGCLFDRGVRQAAAEGLVPNRMLMADSYGIRADIAVPRFQKLLSRVIARAISVLGELGGGVEFLRQEAAELERDNSWQQSKELAEKREGDFLALAELVAEALGELAVEVGQEGRREEALELLSGVVERRARKAEGSGYVVSDVDPQARWRRKKHGKQAFVGYVEGVVMDGETEIITDVEVYAGNTDDSETLADLLAGHKENTGAAPQALVGDSGYHSGANRALLAGEEITDYVAVPTPKGHKQGRFSTSDFEIEWDEEEERPVRALCPGGQLAEGAKWKRETHSWVLYFGKQQCAGCPLRERCTRQKRGRSLSVSRYHRLHEAARERQGSEEGQAAQVARLGIERTFAVQQRRGGLRRARYRGREKVAIQAYLSCTVLNIVRRAKLLLSGYLSDKSREVDANLDKARHRCGLLREADCVC